MVLWCSPSPIRGGVAHSGRSRATASACWVLAFAASRLRTMSSLMLVLRSFVAGVTHPLIRWSRLPMFDAPPCCRRNTFTGGVNGHFRGVRGARLTSARRGLPMVGLAAEVTHAGYPRVRLRAAGPFDALLRPFPGTSIGRDCAESRSDVRVPASRIATD